MKKPTNPQRVLTADEAHALCWYYIASYRILNARRQR